MTLDSIRTPVPTREHGVKRLRTELVVWHSTAGGTARSSLQWIARAGSGAGYHFIIERDGTISASTPLDRTAWHAGLSAWPVPAAGVPRGWSVNNRSIGVSFANMNDGSEAITEAQIVAALALATLLAARYPALGAITAHVRHRDVSPGRKTDPLPSALNWPAFRARLTAALKAA